MNIQQQIEKIFRNKYNYPFFIYSHNATFELNVFNVPYGKIDEIEKFILNLDWLFRLENCNILPFVINKKDTKKYYPEYKNMKIKDVENVVYIGPGQKARNKFQIDLNYGMRGTAIPTDNGVDFRPEGLNIIHYVSAKHLALQDEQRQRINQYL